MPRVALIADTTAPELTSVVRWLRREVPEAWQNTWESIEAWEQAHQHTGPADLTIVLQTWSDQFPPSSVDRLVGLSVSQRLLCCCGDWCESDGRSRPGWPIACRVPLRHARRHIRAELARLDTDHPGLPATAARDEAFLWRQTVRDNSKSATVASVVVVGADRVFRETLAALFRCRGVDASTAPLQSGRRLGFVPPQIVVHDLDPNTERVTDSVRLCQSRPTGTQVLGVASVPRRRVPDTSDVPVLPRLDPDAVVDHVLRHTTAVARSA